MVSYNNEFNKSKKRADFIHDQMGRYHQALQVAKNHKAKELGLTQLEAAYDAAKKERGKAQQYHRAVNRLEADPTLENWNYTLFYDFFDDSDVLKQAIAERNSALALFQRREASGKRANVDDIIALVANIQMAVEAYIQKGSRDWMYSQVKQGRYQLDNDMPTDHPWHYDYRPTDHPWRFVVNNLYLLTINDPEAFEKRVVYHPLRDLLDPIKLSDHIVASGALKKDHQETVFQFIDALIQDKTEREILKGLASKGVSDYALNQSQRHNLGDVDYLISQMTKGCASLEDSIDLDKSNMLENLAEKMITHQVNPQEALQLAENFHYSQSSEFVRYFTATNSSLDKKITASTKAKFDPAALLNQSKAHFRYKEQELESVANNTVKKLRNAGPSLQQCEANLAQTRARYESAKGQVDAIDSNVLTVLKRQVQKSYGAFLKTQEIMGVCESFFYKTKKKEAEAAYSIVRAINSLNTYADACDILRKIFTEKKLNMRDRSFPFMLARTLLRKDGGLFALNICEKGYEEKGDAVTLDLDKETNRLFSGGSDVLGEKVAKAQKTSAWLGIFHVRTTPERRELQDDIVNHTSKVTVKATCAA